MATSYQMDFVDHIESSIKALAVQGKTPPTISAIMLDAGYDAAGLFSIVTRLKESGEKELCSRLRSAFEYAKKIPLCLEDVKPSRNGLSLTEVPCPSISFPANQGPICDLVDEAKTYIPPPKQKDKVTTPPIIHSPPTDDEAEVLAQVITLLRPLRHQGRTRVLGSTSMFYGVGE